MHLQTPLLALALFTLKFSLAALTTEKSGFAFVPMGTSIPTGITESSQLSAAISRISTYQTSLAAQSQYTSVGSIIASAINKAEGNVAATTTVYEPATTYYGVPTGAMWYSALPGDVKGYLMSVASVESRLATGNGAQPTGGVGMVGVGMAVVGGLGAVLAM